MINYKQVSAITLGLLSFGLHAFGSDSYISRSHERDTFGKPSGASFSGGNPLATQTVETNANVKVIGKSLSALTSRVESPNDLSIGNTTYTTIYSFGKRIFADAWFISFGDYNNVRLGLAPTEVRLPFILYTIGPVMLDVAPGVRFLALVEAGMIPEIAFPLKESTLGLSLSARAQAAGFVEAYAEVPIILRLGVGGQLDLMDGRLDINSRISFNGKDKPILIFGGMVEFLKGRFYAFLDVLGIFNIGWRRLIDYDIYKYPGICYSMGVTPCPVN